MDGSQKKISLVGQFIKKRRTELGLSQKALGLAFQPAVTTQFVSNIERGVTPLPPNHVATLCEALKVSDTEIFALLEKDYALKLTGKAAPKGEEAVFLSVHPGDYEILKRFYENYQRASDDQKKAMRDALAAMLKP